MPEKETLQRAKKDAKQGKAPSTQAGEFVREEMDHIREGKHGARSAKQAIAIGLSKARRAGVKLPPRQDGEKTTTPTTRKPSAKRSRASTAALKKEGTAAASHSALARQAKASARKRGPAKRSAAAKKAARTRARSR
ncbi:MAG: DUF6496 domain-containing protein [Acidobacteriota bacterium]